MEITTKDIRNFAEINEAVQSLYENTGLAVRAGALDPKLSGIKSAIHTHNNFTAAFFSKDFLSKTNSFEKEFLLTRNYIDNRNADDGPSRTFLLSSIISFGSVGGLEELRAIYNATTMQWSDALHNQALACFFGVASAYSMGAKQRFENKTAFTSDVLAISLTKDPHAAVEALKKVSEEEKNIPNKNWFDFKDFDFKNTSFKDIFRKFIAEKVIEPMDRLTKPTTQARIENIEKLYSKELAGARGLN